MTSDTAYRVNTERFAHETVDDEVIVIDMDEGNYFSLRGSAARVWQLAAQGWSGHSIVTALHASAEGATLTEIEAGVGTLLSQLVEEAILMLAPVDEPDVRPPELPVSPYARPALEKYTDMQDLLTLDPIHEVDETGWPNRSRTNEP